MTSRAAAGGEAALSLHFRDGELAVVPADAARRPPEPARAPTRAAPRPKPAPPEQGKLL